MTKHPNSDCEEHRDVKANRPVCIVCMGQEIERLRQLGQAVLDTRNAEARALMTLENAQENYSDHGRELDAYMLAAAAASEAEHALAVELTPPNASYTTQNVL